ncbi:MAG: imidazole glycerol phosphate synthase subunit HisH [Oscillospiraceae bacterium]|nr:imidazole glycerol phosphate synthase subunit HisH [Oscillospiraceae bacterium]
MTAIIDYGSGNLYSLSRSLRFLGTDCAVTSDKAEIARADRLILPGVGAFGDAAAKLARHGLDETITAQARSGKPLLGICLGMQLLYEESLEFGRHRGLGLLPGVVRPLRGVINGGLKIPHMGWNDLTVLKKNPLLDLGAKPYVYFVHSFFAGVSGCSIAKTSYGGAEICAVAGRGNVFGTQFHPEKSGDKGLTILKAFCAL